MRIRTAAQEVLVAAALLHETPTVPPVLARAHPSGAVTVSRLDGDHQATNAAVQGTRGGDAVVLGATPCGPVARAHRPHHARAPVPVHVLRHTHHTRGTVEAGLGLGPLVGREGVTAGKISETVGPGLQPSLVQRLGINHSCMQMYTASFVFTLLCAVSTFFSIQLLAIDESSARMGLARCVIIALRTNTTGLAAHPYSASFLIALDIHSSSNSC